MSLDGLRAWIGEVERKLGMRTRVFLALSLIAIGGAGAAIYLAVEARNDSVGEADVRALQDELEERFAGGSTSGLQTQIDALKAEIEALKEERGGGGSGGAGKSGGNDSSSGSGDNGGGAQSGSGGATTTPKAGGNRKSRILELLEQTKRKNAEAERKQNEEGK